MIARTAYACCYRGVLLFLLLGAALGLRADGATAQPDDEALNVLIVTAHPDDETIFAAAVYKITHTLDGNVDLALITDGSGGYDYAMLAEPIYGIQLADEPSARRNLPAIRKQELMAGGKIIGLRNYFFLDELDHMYTTNVDTVLQHVWDVDHVKDHLRKIMTRLDYDYVFTLLPTENMHGHHKAATILALETARSLPAARRPVVLGALMVNAADTAAVAFTELPGYPVTRVAPSTPVFTFDRTQPLESDGLLDYKIIVNWVIAEHKSQGTVQPFINQGDYEYFWFFEANDREQLDETRAFFERLDENPWRTTGMH